MMTSRLTADRQTPTDAGDRQRSGGGAGFPRGDREQDTTRSRRCRSKRSTPLALTAVLLLSAVAARAGQARYGASVNAVRAMTAIRAGAVQFAYLVWNSVCTTLALSSAVFPPRFSSTARA